MSRGNRSIRVLRVISRLNIGGPARHVIILSSRLGFSGDRLSPGFQTLLVSGVVKEYEGDMSYLAEEYGVRVRMIPSLGRELSLLDDVRSFLALYRIMRSFRPDIVHTHASKAGALGRAAAIAAGVRVLVHTFHGHIFRGYFSRRATFLVTAVERFLAIFTKTVVVLSPSQEKDITKKYRIVPRSKVKTIPLGLDLQPYTSAERFSGTFRQSLGFGRDVPVVATAGRLVAIKDLVTF